MFFRLYLRNFPYGKRVVLANATQIEQVTNFPCEYTHGSISQSQNSQSLGSGRSFEGVFPNFI